jgi:hypothetical protein
MIFTFRRRSMKTAYLRIIALPILAMFLMACGPKLELPEGVPSPCDIEQEPLGSMVKVGGEINFLDDSIPGEIYADLEADGCRIGLTVRTETLDGWGPQAQEAIQMGAQIIIEGRLDELPLPARPDEFQYVIALQYPPTLLNESSLVDQPPEEPPLASLSGPACDLSVLQPVLPASSSAMVVISDSGLKQDTGINGHRQNGRFLRKALQ